jgi:hypothetical protein
MGTDKLHEYASELKRYVDDQAISIAAEIEDHPVVGHEIHGSAKLSLYLGGISPSRFGDSGEPRPNYGVSLGWEVGCHRNFEPVVTAACFFVAGP